MNDFACQGNYTKNKPAEYPHFHLKYPGNLTYKLTVFFMWEG